MAVDPGPRPEPSDAADEIAARIEAEPQPPAPPALPDSWAASSRGFRAAGRSRGGRLALALVLVASLAGGAYVLLNRGSAGGVAMAMSFEEGQRLGYRMVLDADLDVSAGTESESLRMSMRQDMSMEVLGVDAEGIATIRVRLDNAEISTGGLPLPPTEVPDEVEVELRIAPDGRVLESQGLTLASGGGGLASFPGTDQFSPLLPDTPVSPGDSWSEDFDQEIPYFDQALHFSVQSSYLRDEEVDGVMAAVIQSHLTVPMDFELDVRELLEGLGGDTSAIPPGTDPVFRYEGTMEADDTSWFDVEAGRVLKSFLSADLDITVSMDGLPASAGGFGEARITGTMTVNILPLD
ncbi:MAG: hypothetical protein HY658_00695 [Actinobacteria bacterium]|nr:hypothetical protein [Actinomycetota bacterium]